MKKVYLIFALLVVVACSNNIESIEKAEKEAIEAIEKAKVNSIAEAGKLIEATASTKILAANDSIELTIQKAQEVLSNEVSTKITLEIKKIKMKISLSLLVAALGFIFGVIGIIAAIMTRRKVKSRRDIIKILSDALYEEPVISERIKMLINQDKQSVNRSQVDGLVRAYFSSKEAKKILENIVGTILKNNSSYSGQSIANSSNERETTTATKIIRQEQVILYARESDTRQLTTVENSFQRGKSVYKLVLTNLEDKKAVLSLCIEQEEAKQRILNTDTQYLEPICNISSLTSTPSEINIKKEGVAEKLGEDWMVTIPIEVELK